MLRLIDVDLVYAAWLARPVAALGGLALGLLGFLLKTYKKDIHTPEDYP